MTWVRAGLWSPGDPEADLTAGPPSGKGEKAMELFDEVLQIVKKKNDDMLDIARRIVAKAKPYIIEAANRREQYVDIDISEEKLTMDQESAWGRHLLKGGLQGFTIRLTGNERGVVTYLRVIVPDVGQLTSDQIRGWMKNGKE